MLISHSHKFVIIDIQKTGTESLRDTLVPLGVVDIIGKGPAHPEFEQFTQHSTAAEAKEHFETNGWNWDEYIKFTRVRNPWARYASFMNYRIQKAHEYESLSSEDKEKFPKHLINRGIGCSNWIKHFNGNEKKLLQNLIEVTMPQADYILDNKDNILIDLVGKVEDINECFKQFCQKTNINPIPPLQHTNKGSYQKPWREYYDQETIDMVVDKEKWVIEKYYYVQFTHDIKEINK